MIEKIIHQVWVGTNPIPKREQECMDALKRMHPDFEYRLWTNEHIPLVETNPNRSKMFKEWSEKKQFAFIADALRLYAVYTFGGFYADVDMVFNETLHSIADTYDGLFFYHPSPNDISLANTFFGAKRLYYPVLHALKEGEICEWWGPEPFGIGIKRGLGIPYDCEDDELIERLKQDNVLSLSWPDNDGKMFRHLSLYSWSNHYEPKAD